VSSDVTVVVATHDRPDTLVVALRSALAQTHSSLEILVIGDCCDPRTEKVVRELRDPRLRYLHLGLRAGEQSGPNSIGIELAETPWIAFLNHDDVWLSDHVARALAALEASGADFYQGAAAVAERSVEDEAGRRIPIFCRRSKRRRKPRNAFDRGVAVLEPVSSWLLRTEAARRIGPWRRAADLYRSPLEDWLLRAWRAGLRCEYGSILTTIQVQTQYTRPSARGFYHEESGEHRFIEAAILSRPVDEARRFLEEEVAIHPDTLGGPIGLVRPETRTQTWLWRAFFNRLTGAFFLHTGLDAASLWARATGRGRAELLREALRRRTREELPPPPTLDALLASLTVPVGPAPRGLEVQ
jgi:hypothetical protein